MHRSRIAVALIIATLAASRPIFAQGDGGRQYSVTAAKAADVNQHTLQVFDPVSKRTTEVFPGAYVSRYGALIMTRIEDVFARVGEADRAALLADNVGAGFDRAITSWRADPAGRTVAVAVRYYRDRLLSRRDLQLSDDYGRPEPLDPAEYEIFAVGVCSRTDADAWTCREEELAAVAKKHNVALPNSGAGRTAAAEKLLELVLGQQ